MKKKNIISLSLIFLVCGGYYFLNDDDSTLSKEINLASYPIYQSKQASVYIYGLDGNLEQLINAQNVKRFEEKNLTEFTSPYVIIYNKEHLNGSQEPEPDWKLTSEQAELFGNNQLNLNGDVVITSLQSDNVLNKIVTSNVDVNIQTQTAKSNERVTTYSDTITSTGIGVSIELKQNSVDVLSDVKTHYDDNPTTSIQQTTQKQPIDVVADQQRIEINNNRIIFSKNVIATQGSLIINAERLDIDNINSQQNQIINATGSPVRFKQQINTSSGPDTVIGSGKKLIYQLKKNTFTLTDNAHIKKSDISVNANEIGYDLTKNSITGTSGNGENVKTRININQMNKKGR